MALRRTGSFRSDTLGKNASTWDRFAEELPKHNAKAERIETVSIDMSPAYKKGASDNCPDAAIVFDRFHVMQTVGKAVDEVRRREHRSLLRKGDKSLKESMWIFRNNPQNLDGRISRRAGGSNCRCRHSYLEPDDWG